jgi:hypothetical protein
MPAAPSPSSARRPDIAFTNLAVEGSRPGSPWTSCARRKPADDRGRRAPARLHLGNDLTRAARGAPPLAPGSSPRDAQEPGGDPEDARAANPQAHPAPGAVRPVAGRGRPAPGAWSARPRSACSCSGTARSKRPRSPRRAAPRSSCPVADTLRGPARAAREGSLPPGPRWACEIAACRLSLPASLVTAKAP